MKIKYQFNKTELASLSKLKDEIIQARKFMSSDDPLDEYTGANYLLYSSLSKYNQLNNKARKFLNINITCIDINDLEKLAVNILVNQGHSKLVKVDLLKKYGVYCGEKGK